MGKVSRGADAVAPAFVQIGFTHPKPLIYLLMLVEFVGGIAIMAGLLTRFFAAAAAIELGYITFVIYWDTGFSWLQRGYEYALMWGLLCLAIALRGGGPYSIDRKLRREL